MDFIFKNNLIRTILITVSVFCAVFTISSPLRAADVLRVYTNCNVEEFEGWVGQAEKAMGVKIEWSGGVSSTEEWARIQAEAPNFQADFCWG
ncbi:MAG: hypothetical protein KAV87_18745, partial [Desulfobacteraceae bacterium]|nr:hypothetical protein [Desulfobacteraceae bacterium]